MSGQCQSFEKMQHVDKNVACCENGVDSYENSLKPLGKPIRILRRPISMFLSCNKWILEMKAIKYYSRIKTFGAFDCMNAFIDWRMYVCLGFLYFMSIQYLLFHTTTW